MTYTRMYTYTHTNYTIITEQYVILLWRTGNKKIIQVPGSILRKLVVLPSMVFFFLFILENGYVSLSERIASQSVGSFLSYLKLLKRSDELRDLRRRN